MGNCSDCSREARINGNMMFEADDAPTFAEQTIDGSFAGVNVDHPDNDEVVRSPNAILEFLWPRLDRIAQNIIHEKVTPSINEQLPRPFKLHFEQFSLGKQPPHFGAMRMRQTSDEKGVLLYVPLDFHSNSVLNIRIGPARLGLVGFAISGELMIRLHPFMDEAPFCGGVSFCFLERPFIGFELTGLGAIAEIPGIRGLMKLAVDSTIFGLCVIPNRFSVLLGTEEQGIDPSHIKHPPPMGLLEVTAISASGLRQADLFGSADPYVQVRIGNDTWCSSTIFRNQNPTWKNERHYFMVWFPRQPVHVSMFDRDTLSQDDDLGSVQGFSTLEAAKKSGEDLPLVFEGRASGTVKLGFKWLQVAPENVSGLPANPEQDYNLPYVLVISIDKLWLPKGFSDPVKVIAKVGGSTRETSFFKRQEAPPKLPTDAGMERVVMKLSQQKMLDKSISEITGLSLQEVAAIKAVRGTGQDQAQALLESRNRDIDTNFYFVVTSKQVKTQELELIVKSSYEVMGAIRLPILEQIQSGVPPKRILNDVVAWVSVTLLGSRKNPSSSFRSMTSLDVAQGTANSGKSSSSLDKE